MTTTLSQPWQPEITVSPELARRLIETQFPSLAPCEISWLGEGWDNTVYLVNQTLTFRFPRRKFAVELIATEYSLLPTLASRLPLSVPVPLYLGEPDLGYPWPFSGGPYLPGQTACRARLSVDEREAFVEPLAEFLRALHGVPIQEAQALGVKPDQIGRLDIGSRWPRTLAALRKMEELGIECDLKSLLDTLDKLKNVRNEGAIVLAHGDLYSRHFLVNDQRRLCGVIDWGDVHIGNAAVDLTLCFTFFPPRLRPAFLHAYGQVEAETLRMARFRGLFQSVMLVLFAHDVGDKDLFEETLLSLQWLL